MTRPNGFLLRVDCDNIPAKTRRPVVCRLRPPAIRFSVSPLEKLDVQITGTAYYGDILPIVQ